MNKTKLATLVAASSIVLLSACGGGGGSSSTPAPTPTPAPSPTPPPSNSAPQAKNDALVLLNGQSGKVDVLANDTDANGDTLSITAITSMPSFGSAEIVDGQIEYTPADPFMAGQDTLVYQVSDGESTASASVSLSLTQSLSLSGKVSGNNMSGATLVVSNGTQSEIATIDAQGNYSLTMVVENSNQAITFTATSTDGFSQKASRLVDLNQLLEDTGRTISGEQVPSLNLGYVSTADYLLDTSSDFGKTATQAKTSSRSLNTQRRIELAAFIKLLAEDEDYEHPQADNLLAFMTSEEFSSPEQAMFYYLKAADLMTSEENIEQSHKLKIARVSVSLIDELSAVTSTGFTELLGETAILLPAYRQGYLPYEGDVLELKDDGEASIVFGTDQQQPLNASWLLENSELQVLYSRESERYPGVNIDDTGTARLDCCNYAYYVSTFGAEVAELIKENQYQFPSGQIHVITREQKQTFKIVSVDGEMLKVIGIVEREQELNLPSHFRPESGNPVAQLAPEVRYYNLHIVGENLMTEESIQGVWSLPIQRDDNPFSRTKLYQDKVELRSTGATVTSYTENSFNWTFSDGVLSLIGRNYTYQYIPFMANNNQWMTIVKRFDGDELTFITVEKIAKFDEDTSRFTEFAVTSLPQILIKQASYWNPEIWHDNRIKVANVFGHQLHSDGTALANIRIDGGEESIGFQGMMGYQWTFERGHVAVTMIEPEEFKVFRYWDVVSVYDDGTMLFLEQLFYYYDENNNNDLSDDQHIILNSILTTYQAQPLTQWPDAWANSDL